MQANTGAKRVAMKSISKIVTRAERARDDMRCLLQARLALPLSHGLRSPLRVIPLRINEKTVDDVAPKAMATTSRFCDESIRFTGLGKKKVN